MRWLWLAIAFLLVVAAAAVWHAFSSPGFVLSLGAAAAAAAFKAMLPRLAPRDFTPEQRERIRAGLDPFPTPYNRREK